MNIENYLGVIFITHDPSLANRADRMVEIKDGIIVEDRVSVSK
jgi:putative ABC transport system ATP-binding protein